MSQQGSKNASGNRTATEKRAFVGFMGHFSRSLNCLTPAVLLLSVDTFFLEHYKSHMASDCEYVYTALGSLIWWATGTLQQGLRLGWAVGSLPTQPRYDSMYGRSSRNMVEPFVENFCFVDSFIFHTERKCHFCYAVQLRSN